MGGFDAERARTVLEVPDAQTVQVMIAVGHPGKVEELPEKLQAPRAAEPPSTRARAYRQRPGPR